MIIIMMMIIVLNDDNSLNDDSDYDVVVIILYKIDYLVTYSKHLLIVSSFIVQTGRYLL